jgi:uncharacterized protein YlzI (FlbEa/FlbD family)
VTLIRLIPDPVWVNVDQIETIRGRYERAVITLRSGREIEIECTPERLVEILRPGPTIEESPFVNYTGFEYVPD